MAEEAQELEQAQEEEQPTDWQAKYEAMRQHSRDWEKKAKENLGAAEELAKLKEQQMTEQEKANARAEKAESELADMKAKADRLETAQRIAEETGVPLGLLQYCAAEDMEAFAESYIREREQAQPNAAPKAVGSKVIKGSGEKLSNADLFAQTASTLFKQ